MTLYGFDTLQYSRGELRDLLSAMFTTAAIAVIKKFGKMKVVALNTLGAENTSLQMWLLIIQGFVS